ncbi:MAG: hypothetical protein AAF587_23865 [Bacteroidota bacterium]
MLRRLEFLVPPLLKRIDRQLLLHRPGLWATRLHYVAFYGSILSLLMGLYTLIRPISLHSVPNPENYFALLLLPVAVGFGLWVYHLTFFRLEQFQGKNWRLNSLRDELLHLGVLASLISIPLMYGYQLSNRIDQTITESELARDINTLKVGSQLFKYGVQSPNDYRFTNMEWYTTLHYGLEGEYFEYEVIQKNLPYSSCKNRQLIEEFLFVFAKYTDFTIPLSSYEILEAYRDEQPLQIADFAMYEQMLRENISNLAQAKTRSFAIMDADFLKSLVFICFMLWLGLQAFLKTNWKSFLGALIVGGLWSLSIALTASILDASFHIYPEKFVFMLMMAGLGFFLYQGYRQKNTKRTHQWKVISLTLGTLMLPFAPLIIGSFIDSNIYGDAWFNILFAGMGVSFITWNLTLRSRFVDLMASPKEN